MGRAYSLMVRGGDHTDPLTEAESNEAYDGAGTADATLTAHEAEADPHPQYLTPAEGAAAFAPLAHAGHATDAQLRDRSTHTGTQLAATISDFDEAVRGTVFCGSYTPTPTGVTNVASVGPADPAQYSVVPGVGTSRVVTVSGCLSITPTAANAATEVGIPLPIAANFATGLSNTCNGTAVSENTSDQACAQILPDDTNDRAKLLFYSKSTTRRTWSFHFTYTVP